MKISITQVLQIALNILIIVFSYATYSLISHQIKDIFTRNDHVLNQQKAEFIAKSIRPMIPSRDYVSMRTAFKNALNDTAIQFVRFIPEDSSEGVCTTANNNDSCFSTTQSIFQVHLTTLYFDPENKQPMGAVQVGFHNEGSAQLDRAIRTYLGIALFVIVTFFNFIVFFSFRTIRRQIEWSIDAVRRITRGDEVPLQNSTLVEKSQFSSALIDLKTVLKDYKADIELASTKAALGEVAKKVAHDIRDPLLALDSTLSLLEQMPEEKRVLTRKAIARIRSIANDLIETNKFITQEKGKLHSSQLAVEEKHSSSIELLSLINTVVSEKQMQLSSKKNVKIHTALEEKFYGVFVHVKESEFHRVLSNLINNAVEALADQGTVTISAEKNGDQVSIQITDNGCGMSEHIRSQILSHGGTFNKAGGSGIGMRSAIEIIQSWGGQLGIETSIGKGTTVTITIPQSQSPGWFVPELLVQLGDIICVLDDEETAHQIWKYRFEKACIPEGTISIHHFYTANELMDWYYNNQSVGNRILYLCDFELIGQHLNGIEVIKLLNIEAQSILVTSRYDEATIRKQCVEHKIRLLPKPMAGLVPLHWMSEVKLDCAPWMGQFSALVEQRTIGC